MGGADVTRNRFVASARDTTPRTAAPVPGDGDRGRLVALGPTGGIQCAAFMEGEQQARGEPLRRICLVYVTTVATDKQPPIREVKKHCRATKSTPATLPCRAGPNLDDEGGRRLAAPAAAPTSGPAPTPKTRESFCPSGAL